MCNFIFSKQEPLQQHHITVILLFPKLLYSLFFLQRANKKLSVLLGYYIAI